MVGLFLSIRKLVGKNLNISEIILIIFKQEKVRYHSIIIPNIFSREYSSGITLFYDQITFIFFMFQGRVKRQNEIMLDIETKL